MPSPMSESRPSVLVTAVGALIGQGIVRSLRSSGNSVHVVGIDRVVNHYGAGIVDVFRTKPCRETDPGYLEWLHHLIESERVDLVLPGIEEDLFFFHDHAGAMRDWPVRVVMNSNEAIEAGRDKWRMHQSLVASGIEAIPTVLAPDLKVCAVQLGGAPYLVKARRGSGSRGQSIILGEDEWKERKAGYDDGFIVQRVVGEDHEEYTVGLFGLGDGDETEIFVLKRRLWNGGTWQAEVVPADRRLTETCASLNRILRPLGPTNYQFRRTDDAWYLLEVNPRFSASTAIRAGFGFNEAKMCLDYFLWGKKPQHGPLRGGICQRYIAEYFIHE